MGFWTLMLIAAILCPILMIGAGLFFRNTAPKKINYFFGYRTERSMKNKDTWVFAHKYIGNLWLILGLTLIVPSAVPMFFVIGKSEELIGVISLIICVVGLVALIASIILTEKALKKTFDKDGNRIN